jgi:hypothetical protein
LQVKLKVGDNSVARFVAEKVIELAQRGIRDPDVLRTMTFSSTGCPLYLQKRTLVERIGMSAKGQKRKYQIGKIDSSVRRAEASVEFPIQATPNNVELGPTKARTGSSLMDCGAAIVVQTQPGEMPVTAQSSAMASVSPRQPRPSFRLNPHQIHG